MTETTAGGRVRLPGLGSAAFVSETDRVALEIDLLCDTEASTRQ